MQIYHDGSDSYVLDNGTGNLNIRSNGAGTIVADSGGVVQARFLNSNACDFNFNGSQKLATTSTGVDVTGDVLADTVTLDNGSNDWQFSVSGNNLIISYGGTSKAKLDSSGNLTVVGDVTAFGTI